MVKGLGLSVFVLFGANSSIVKEDVSQNSSKPKEWELLPN